MESRVAERRLKTSSEPYPQSTGRDVEVLPIVRKNVVTGEKIGRSQSVATRRNINNIRPWAKAHGYFQIIAPRWRSKTENAPQGLPTAKSRLK